MFGNLPIESERVVLRPFTTADLDVFRTIATREDVLEYLPGSEGIAREKLGMRRERTVRGLSESHKDYDGHSFYAAGRPREEGESG